MPEKPVIKLKRIRSRGPLAEKAYAILKDAIIQGQFAPGTWLHEEQAKGIPLTYVLLFRH